MKDLYERNIPKILIFLMVSCLGWIMETLACAIQFGQYLDRGFLHLPFCTIYGVCILAIDLLMGTPGEGGILLRWCQKRGLRYVLYTLLAMLIPTAAELVTGVTFEKVFGVRLWDYTWHRFDYLGYVSLEMALVWGVGVWAIMGLVYPRLEKLVARIPARWAKTVTTVTLLAIAVDWVICVLK